MHLTFDELELRDLSLGLTVRPGLGDCRSDGGLVSCDARRERRDEGQPAFQQF